MDRAIPPSIGKEGSPGRHQSGPIRSNSLDDGRYTLTALASQISSGNFDGDGNGTGGDNYVLIGDLNNKLFCLFGDNDGDGDVDSSDFGQFRTAYGGANSTFDFDGDGDVDSSDFGQFRTRFGATI